MSDGDARIILALSQARVDENCEFCWIIKEMYDIEGLQNYMFDSTIRCIFSEK